MQIELYRNLMNKNPHIYDIAKFDLLAMLKAYDTMDETNEIQRNNVLLHAEKLNEWLRDSETEKIRGSCALSIYVRF